MPTVEGRCSLTAMEAGSCFDDMVEWGYVCPCVVEQKRAA